jgi:hypothetical protein
MTQTANAERPVLVRVVLGYNGTVIEKVYEGCFATLEGGHLVVRESGEPPEHIYRARFHDSAVLYVEHEGPHIAVRSAPVRRAPQGPPRGPAVTRESIEAGMTFKAAQKAPPADLPTDEAAEAAMERFLAVTDPPAFPDHLPRPEPRKDTRSIAQRIVDELEERESPKAITAPDTAEGSGSDPKTIETPSGKYVVKMPLETQPEEVERRQEALLGPEFNGPVWTDEANRFEETGRLDPIDTSKPLRASSKQKHGSHGKPKNMPGTALLVAVALFLAACFRHQG